MCRRRRFFCKNSVEMKMLVYYFFLLSKTKENCVSSEIMRTFFEHVTFSSCFAESLVLNNG